MSRRTKKPIGNAWQHRRLGSKTVAEAFNGADMNVGVQMGPMSDGLSDVDLDCREAVAIGPMLLPKSNNVFGRASKPRSHWLYTTTLAEKIAKACLQFKDVDGVMMLELKIGGGGKGSQSVFPGSTHESGEAIEWDRDDALVTTDDDELLRQVHRLAVAAMLARHWPGKGERHDAALTVGGFLARAGFNENEAALMLEAIARAARDEEGADRAQAARDAVKQYGNGGETRGLPMLAETFGEKVAAKAAQWLGYTPEAGQEQQPPGMEGVALADFRAYLPDHSYIFTPTGAFWSIAGVNACLGRGANKQIDRNQPVHHLTWAPGHPMLIENQLVVDGGWIERNGVTTFNLYRPPTLKHGDASKAGPWIELVHKVYPKDAERLITYLAHRVQRPEREDQPWSGAGRRAGHRQGHHPRTREARRRSVEFQRDLAATDTGTFQRLPAVGHHAHQRGARPRRIQPLSVLRAHESLPCRAARCAARGREEHSRARRMNCIAVILTTNRLTDGIFLPSDDRRHDVMWSELTKDDFTESYWNSIWNWYDAGGDSHVAAYLATLDISASTRKHRRPRRRHSGPSSTPTARPRRASLQDLLDKLGNPDAVTVHQIIKAASAQTSGHHELAYRPKEPARHPASVRRSRLCPSAQRRPRRPLGRRRRPAGGLREEEPLARDRLGAVTALQRKADEEERREAAEIAAREVEREKTARL